MTAVFGLLSFVGCIVFIIMLVIALVRRKPKKIAGIGAIATFVIFVICMVATPSANKETPNGEVEVVEAIKEPMTENKAESTATPTPIETPEPTPDPTPDPISDGIYQIGKYQVKYVGATLGKDYESKDCVIITYEFTNNEEEAKSFIFAVGDKPFQNGIELLSALMVEGVDAQESMKDIKSGATIEVKKAYILADLESDIELELSEAISFSKKKDILIIKMADIIQ